MNNTPKEPSKKPKILAIDDSENNLVLLHDLFEEFGIDVITANDGIKGLEIMENEKPDLILLDIMMPETDGYKILKLKNSKHKELREIPVIIVSALKNPRIETLIQENIIEIIHKPIDLDFLINKVLKHLNYESTR